ncbi:unnamed protein product [Phytophthora lilii]|uniref:Unnamed protein product n=1 Tax=Phytophthora lilii TaxID=2077276 RepID=A0A9W6U730_9STRA|nr:unnamed protein product [Phytophthora lilii]
MEALSVQDVRHEVNEEREEKTEEADPAQHQRRFVQEAEADATVIRGFPPLPTLRKSVKLLQEHLTQSVLGPDVHE